MREQHCIGSEKCLCGGLASSVTEADAKIFGYELFYLNESESYKIVVKAGEMLKTGPLTYVCNVNPLTALLPPSM